MSKNRKIFKLKCFSIIVMLFISITSFCVVKAENNNSIQEINSFDDLFILAQASKNFDYKGVTVVLNKDIEINEIEQAMLDKYGIKHLTIGSKDMPFKGIFDGQGHKIIGLKYDANIIKDANSGLFSFIENATIKNLIVENAELDCAFQGGMIVGRAKNSTLEDITVLNSKLHITTANNVLSLITNGGFSGGGIAGIIEDSLMYNCEVSGTEVVNNSTSGITGVGGEGLYMGALVGWASNSTIEYCRARANYAGESQKELRNTTVRNDYEIAVGALGGKSVYAGGIVGGVNNKTEIIDCFSTADVSFDVRNYVAVGSGIAGYAGGITAALRGESKIERCHFAGDIKSYQYNAVLVIPIIQHNVNINGIARIVGDKSIVNNSYFKPSSIKSGVTITAIDDIDTESYGPKDDETYIDIDFWELKGYDFIGTHERTSTNYTSTHYNKWVMDDDLGIPVHGNSIMATFDFPDAGNVSIKRSALVHKEAITDDPLNFAIQGIHPREKQESTITLNLIDSDAYRLKGWYKISDVTRHEVDNISKLHEWINGIDPIAQTDGQLSITQPIKDRDLFIASVEARVVFHDVNGNPIENQTYWHLYETLLEDVKPCKIENCTFYGWTTMGQLNDQQQMIGYDGITSTELNDIIQANELYKANDPVEKPLNLYPIYINSLANVVTEFEGHEQDTIDDKTRREGVGYTEVLVNENDEVIIKALAEDGTTNFPDGYEFKGWYQRYDDGFEYRISEDIEYIVPDTSQQVTYIAKFRYRVDYISKALHGNSAHLSEKKFTSLYYDYNELFKNIKGPEYVLESVVNWGTDYVLHEKAEQCSDGFSGNIVEPIIVKSHNIAVNNGFIDKQKFIMSTDFPNSGLFASKKDGNYKLLYKFEPISEHYHLQFWTLENLDSLEGWTYNENPMNTGVLAHSDTYEGFALVSADVNFHINDNEFRTVQRRYDDPIFRNEDYVHEYVYPVLQTSVNKITVEGNEITGTLLEEKSFLNEEMNKDGYQFLGWVSRNEITDDEWNYIFDRSEWGVTSNPDKAKPYLLNPDWVNGNNLPNRYKVKETMDLYPVYAKYQVTTTTNIHEVKNLPDEINRPSVPSFVIEPNIDYGTGNITLTVLHDKELVKNGDTKKYQLVSLLCEVDGKTQKLALTLDENNNYIYTGRIKAGKEYKFTAVYSPAILTYHLNDNNLTSIQIKDVGSKLGDTLSPDFNNIKDIYDSYFYGWTTQKPLDGFIWKFSSKYDFDALSFVNQNTVIKSSMDLYPVFVKSSIAVNSNIDDVIINANLNPSNYRFITRNEDGSLQLNVSFYPGYRFVGWYINYGLDNEQLITEDKVKKLNSDELFGGNTYTAKFEKAFTVRYFDDDGNELYSVNVIENSRSFIEKVVIDNEEKEVMIDSTAISEMTKKLQSNEIFYEWEWDNNGNKVSWQDFKDKLISQDMNLYPKIAVVNAIDSHQQDVTPLLQFQIVFNNTENELVSLLDKTYTQPNITINLERKCWNPETQLMEQSPVQDFATSVFIEKTLDEGTQHSGYLEASKGPIYTDSNGNAVHEFFATLIINKEYNDQTINGNIFIEITNAENNTLKLPMEVVNGKGTITLSLPVGVYQLDEDTRWSWRDEVINSNEHSSISLHIAETNTVVIRNERINSNWFSDEVHNKNIFH